MAQKRIYELTENTAPDADYCLPIDKSGAASAQRVTLANLQLSLPGVIRAIAEVVPGGILRAGKQDFGDARTGWWLGVAADGNPKFDLGVLGSTLRWDPDAGLVLSIRTDNDLIHGYVAGVLQWSLTQYGFELVAHEDPQTITFVRETTRAVIGRIVGEENPGDNAVSLDLQALPAVTASDVSATIAAQAWMPGGLQELLAQLGMYAPAGGTPVARFSFKTPSTSVPDLARIEAVNNTDGAILGVRGIEFVALAETTTTPSTEIGRWMFEWGTVAHETRAGAFRLYLQDASGEHEVFSVTPDIAHMGDLYAEGTLYTNALSISDGDSHLLAGDGSWSHGYDKVTGDVDGNVSALTLTGRDGFIGPSLTMAEITAPSAPAANNGVLFARDDGAGVTQLCARFSSGDILPLGVQGLTLPTYSASNVTTDRTYDANATTLDELADVVGTLIADLQARKFIL